jgi:hypothetical protein
VDAISAESLRRVRDGSAKREKAQQLIVKGPEILDGIATSPKASDKHKIDAVRALNSLAGGNSPEAAQEDRIVIRIDLGADIRAKGGTPMTFEVTPNPNNAAPNTIDATAQELPPPRRGPGRPPGSKNKPKVTDDSDE